MTRQQFARAWRARAMRLHPAHRVIRYRTRLRTPTLISRLPKSVSVGNLIERAAISGTVSAGLSAVPIIGGALQQLTPLLAPAVTDVVDALGSALSGLGDAFTGHDAAWIAANNAAIVRAAAAVAIPATYNLTAGGRGGVRLA